MSAPPQIWAICMAVSVGATLGVTAFDHRCRTGNWPAPHRTDWGTVISTVSSVGRRRFSGWARSWLDEEQRFVRVLEVIMSLGLLIRAGIWSAAYAVGGDGSTEVKHGWDRIPIPDARLDTRIGIAVLQLSIVGIWTQWSSNIEVTWPLALADIARLVLVLQAAPLLLDAVVIATELFNMTLTKITEGANNG